MVEFLVGVDGGGTATRAVIALREGAVLGEGHAGPSALGQGIPAAWAQIELAIRNAFDAANLPLPAWSRCAVGAGLSGVSNRPWRDEFVASNIGFARLIAETDSFTMLLGAHRGRPGAIVAAGTGSVGEVLRADGSRFSVGGWGFPVGDEGSGAWLGLRAVRLAQCAMDGRINAGALVRHVWSICGADRDALQAWCDHAGQFAYAQLAPAIFDAEASDPAAAHLLSRAVSSLDATALALDPHGGLPLAVCGSIGRRLADRLSPAVRSRLVEAAEGPAAGALTLIRHAVAAA
ncbi:BadF/BadG/BcrA/BcrD ATPase family protein [Piscinibacter sp.]|uniref:BadF/BadG/BcrA/BcrD ATPase family protein n=1 Tax=Piscinibacter sp. TaxID=1903157 RepID=UPI002C9C28E7|nr:BadF/BadG/BcrA/BcrD ATPase family protein [Albitalea sp.]HUG25694.1 BadF/BadG/BcrA/BcrD ATPase family protein [Albitalea sp.]